MSYYKEILFGKEAREKIIKGVNIVAEAVVSTLGPKGQNVVFDEGNMPIVTKDGVTVAQQIILKDKFENIGAQIAKEASEKTNREAGDGTTSTAAILRDVVNLGNEKILSGYNSVILKRGMDHAIDKIVEEVSKNVITVDTDEMLTNVAVISANNDIEVGTLISGVIKEVGKDGVITVTGNNNNKNEVEYIKGTKLEKGFESHMFINNRKKLSCDLQSPAIIITTDRITHFSQIVNIIQDVINSGKREMVLIADSIEDIALGFLISNHLNNKFTCVPIRIPSFGDYQRDLVYDIATLLNATVLGEAEGKRIDAGKYTDCGTAENVFIGRDNTIFSGGSGDVSKRIEEAQELMKNEKDDFRRSMLRKRIGRLTGSIANIKVGGSSDTEQTEKRYRIEDAINAVKSSMEEGIVEGAGTALVRAVNELNNYIPKGHRDFVAGFNVVLNAAGSVFRAILKNAGINDEVVLNKILESKEKIGYNSLTDTYEDLIKSGVIDPFKCIKSELNNAVATASTLLTSNVAITTVVEKDK